MYDELTPTLLTLLGQASNAPGFLQTCQALKIRQLPQTFEQLKVEAEPGEFEDEDDEEYELTQRSRDSQIIDVEKFGLVMIYNTAEEYRTTYGSAPQGADFVLHELAFYAEGVRGAVAYPGPLPYGLSFDQRLWSEQALSLGPLLAERDVYDIKARQYMPQTHVVNAGFDPQSGKLLHVHVRQQGLFDRCQRGEVVFPFTQEQHSFYTAALGALITRSSVQAVFDHLGVDPQKRESAHCPEEINDAEVSRGITLHVRGPRQAGIKTALGESVVFVLAGVVFKRMGDLASRGYFGHLPFELGFWMTPEQVRLKVGLAPIWEHKSEQLMSLMWRLPDGQLVQAMFSLIDWQLYRLSVWAPFMDKEFKLDEKKSSRAKIGARK